MKLLKAIGNFFSFILAIVFFALLFSFITILFFKNSLQEKTLFSYVKETNIMSLPANDIYNEKNKTLKDALTEKLKSYGATDNLINETIAEYKIEHLMANYGSKYIDYVLFEKEKPILNSIDIYNIINTEMISSYANRILTIKEKENFNKFVINTVDTANNIIPDKEEIIEKENIPYFQEILDFVYSDNFLAIAIANLLLIFVLTALLTWSVYKPFAFLGVPTTIVGSIMLLSYLVQKIGIKYFIKNNGMIESFMKNFIDVLSKHYLIYGIIVLVSGIVMLIIYSIVSKIIAKKEVIEEIEEKPKRRKVTNPDTEIIERDK